MSDVQAILFDLDDTLVDFMHTKRSSVKAAITAMIDAGLDIPFDEVHDAIWDIYDHEGIEFQEVFDRFLIDRLGRLNYKYLASAIIAYRRAREASMVLYPHVRSTLVELVRRGYRLAVISDAPAKQAWLRLCAMGLQHFFESVITFEDSGEKKPHPMPFRKALEALKVQADQAIMIGDWPERDMEGAGALGIHTVYAKYGSRHEKFSEPDFEIDDIAQLLDILDHLKAES